MTPHTYHALTPLQTLILEQALVMARQVEQAAAGAPDGQVLARIEATAVPAARELARLAVEHAAQAQDGAAEKRGHPAASARPADAPPPTRATPCATS